MIQIIKSSAREVATASAGNPVVSTLTIMLFWVFFNIIEASVERMIFGERFEHMLDPIFGAAFLAYAAYCVVACAEFNSAQAAAKEQI